MPKPEMGWGVFNADGELVWRQAPFSLPVFPAVFRSEDKKKAEKYASQLLGHTVQEVRISVKRRKRRGVKDG